MVLVLENLQISLCFSLEHSGDVQYFQFDSTGNMFVFEPGAGFSGPSLKIEPGFQDEDTQKLDFSQVNVTPCSQKDAKCDVTACSQNVISGSFDKSQEKTKRYLFITIYGKLIVIMYNVILMFKCYVGCNL